MSLTAICTIQLIFEILNVLVDSRLSLVDHGEPLRPVALVPPTLIVSLIFLPLLGLISAFVFVGHQFPPARILKNFRVAKYKSNNNTDILTKQLLCKIAFKSKVNQVLNNLYNSFFRLFNAQITAKDTLSSPRHTPTESLRCGTWCRSHDTYSPSIQPTKKPVLSAKRSSSRNSSWASSIMLSLINSTIIAAVGGTFGVLPC